MKPIPLLEINNLWKSFGGLVAIKNLSLSVEQGDILGLIGPNGSGKTTLFEIISGFTTPKSGAIRFNGNNIVGLSPFSICKKGICRTFQMERPFPNLTVIENIMIGFLAMGEKMEIAKKESLEILKFVGLINFQQIEARFLSIGHKKMLELAKALATRPKLLLIDEIMAGQTEKEIQHAINVVRKIRAKGVTIILVEHIMRVVLDLVERIIVINYGEKIAEGTPVEICKDQKVIDAYLGKNFSLRL